MQTRFITLIACLSIGVGLVYGWLIGARWPAPEDAGGTILLDPPAQDDFIIMTAEAYARDNNGRLAQERLSRVPEARLDLRVEKLALAYAPQHDLIATNLAHLAVALGSRAPTLVTLNFQPTPIKAVAQEPAPTPSAAPTSATEPPLTPDTVTPATQIGLAPTRQASPSATRVTRRLPAPSPTASPTAYPVPVESIPTATASVPKTRVPAPTRQPSKTDTANTSRPNLHASGAAPLEPMPRNLVARTIKVDLPGALGEAPLAIALTARPKQCTPANQLPSVVNQTLALCAGQTYPPFRVDGSNITIFGDPPGTAIIRGPARDFAIRVTGSNITIVGVHIEAATDPADLNKWLCFYAACNFKDGPVNGGLAYGGGILLDNTTNAAVISSFVSHGTIGVASLRGLNNKLAQNNFSNLNGWGTLSLYTNHDYIVGNVMRKINRPCLGLDGAYYQSGCESAGAALLAAQSTVIANNHCDHSGDCFYAPGDGGFASNDNKFYNNYCAATNANCFEITFSKGNEFDYNIATADPDTHETCFYPFWIAGSTVRFGGHNTWTCKRDFNRALRDSKAATDKTTEIQGF